MSYSSFGLINSAGFKRTPQSSGPIGYTPVASGNLTAFFLSSMTNLITQSAGKVSQQDAYLGSGVAVQPTSGDQPTTGATTLNSKNVLDFAGGGDRLLSNVDFNVSSASQAITLGILAKRNAGLSEVTSFSGQWSQSGGDYRRWKLQINASNELELWSNTEFGQFDVSEADFDGEDWTMYWVTFPANGPLALTYNNNVNVGSIIKSIKTNANIGTIFGGAAPSESTTWKGSIASVAIWNKALSNAEKTTEIGNIDTYWGLSL